MRPQDSEKNIERALVRYVKAKGGWSLKLASTFVIGLPDRLVLLPGGRALFVELKSKGEKPRKIQLFIHRKLRALGFTVLVIDSIEMLNGIT